MKIAFFAESSIVIGHKAKSPQFSIKVRQKRLT
jgi:hypothetical protein